MLESLGWNDFFVQAAGPLLDGVSPARVLEVHGRILRILGTAGETWAETTGRLRHQAAGAAELPTVGDWVLARAPDVGGHAVIERVLPRRTRLSRKAAGERTVEQVVAANVDTVLILQALDRDFNLRRLERYLVLARDGGVTPVVVLTKRDLCDAADERIREAARAAPTVRVVAVSARLPGGLEPMHEFLEPGRTVALVGSSGVGKSTIANALIGRAVLRVAEVRPGDGRGRHTTTSRRLLPLPSGALLLDTPGMRELAPWDGGEALDTTFDEIHALASGCRFADCRHEAEPGCAVLQAEAEGRVEPGRLQGFRKLLAETAHLEREQQVAKRLERKAQGRQASKALKRMYKDRG